MKVSILIPAYNEEQTIIQILKKVNDKIKEIKYFNFEIIIVDDFSNDKTVILLEQNQKLEDEAKAAEDKGKKETAKKLRAEKVYVSEEQQAAIPEALGYGEKYPEVKRVAEMYKVFKSYLRPSEAFITLRSLATLRILKTVTFIFIEAKKPSKSDINEIITMQKSNLFQFT
jgi:glycosyltransferase involved in cell wall biosynthesis